jgi:hypothetical protein
LISKEFAKILVNVLHSERTSQESLSDHLLTPIDPKTQETISGFIKRIGELFDDSFLWESEQADGTCLHIKNIYTQLEDAIKTASQESPLLELQQFEKRRVCWSYIGSDILQLWDADTNDYGISIWTEGISGIAWLIESGFKISTTSPRPGDIAVYYKNRSDDITVCPIHYAIVDEINSDGQIFCTSKWDHGPLVYHEISMVPKEYGEKVVFLTCD